MHHFSEVDSYRPLLFILQCLSAVVQEIAPVAIVAMPISEKHHAFLGLIETVLLIVLPELVRAVCKFAPSLIGAMPKLYELFA